MKRKTLKLYDEAAASVALDKDGQAVTMTESQVVGMFIEKVNVLEARVKHLEQQMKLKADAPWIHLTGGEKPENG